MFIWNHYWLWKSYPRMNQPHYCSKCGIQLKKVKRIEVLAKGSELRMILNRSYNLKDNRLGAAKYHWTEFRCPTCGKWYSIDLLKKLEEER